MIINGKLIKRILRSAEYNTTNRFIDEALPNNVRLILRDSWWWYIHLSKQNEEYINLFHLNVTTFLMAVEMKWPLSKEGKQALYDLPKI